ncbi:MAG: aspartyl protease family protein [Bryobacteraceae bacterium]|jgi:hypothetical protein
MFPLRFKTRYRFDDRQTGIAVPVSLRVSDVSLDLTAKIDTGADYCMFERGYAEALAIDVEKGELREFSSMGGSFQAFGHELTIQVLDLTLDSTTVYFYQDSGKMRNVLGRHGFLNRVRLGLIEHDSAVYCSPYDDDLED